MTIIKNIKSGIFQGIGILLIIGLTGIAYGAYVAMTDVTTGQALSASTFNVVQENIRSLKTTVDGLTNVPVGAVMAFNGTTCPTGWTAADGSGDEKNTSGVNTTLDLRGEFIRGLDSSRGVDSGRTLGTLQRGSLVMNANVNTENRIFNLSHQNDNRLGYDPAITDSTKPYYYGQITTATYATWATNGAIDANYVQMTRPRNVALLYCVKQ